MSTRQNKKRKGRNNLNNRERTVTTLTEDPNTPYLVPTPSEEPAGANLMSSPFSVTSSGTNQPNIPASGFPIPGSFGFPYNNYMPPIHTNVHPQQQAQPFFQPPAQPVLPPGQNDLEILEKLKKMIKDGQHEFYRPVPQPAALASLYLGPASQNQVPPHPEQVPDHAHHQTFHEKISDPPSAGNNGSTIVSSPSVSSRRPSQTQAKEFWDGQRKSVVRPPSVSSSQISNNSNQKSPTQPPGSRHNSVNSKPSGTNVPPSSGPKSGSDSRRQSLDTKPPSAPAGSDVPSPSRRFRATANTDTSSKPLAVQVPGDQNHDQQRSAGDRLGSAEFAHGMTASPEEMAAARSPFDGKKPTSPRDPGWQQQESPVSPDDRPRLDADGPIARSSNPEATPNAGDAAIRPPGPRDVRYNDRERDRSRERDRDQERDRSWDMRGRDRDRRFDYRFRQEYRRPPPYQRHYEPRHSEMPPPRRYESKPSDETLPVDQRPDTARSVPLAPSDDRGGRVATLEDRPVHRPANDRSPPRALPPDNQPSRVAPAEDRRARPASTDDRRTSMDDRVNRPTTAQTPAENSASRSGNTEIRASRPPPQPPAAEDRTTQSNAEERINRPTPSLQDRLSQPLPSARPENSHLTRQPSLGERLSYASTAVTDHNRPAQPDDRLARSTQPSSGGPDRARPAPPGDERSRPVEVTRPAPTSHDARPAHPEDRSVRPAPSDRDRYVRPMTPVQDRAPPRSGGYGPPPHRSASATREDPRAPLARKTPPSPARPFRAAVVDPPRGRPELRNGFRPESDRYAADDRRSDLMDVDGSPRFSDTRVPYNRRFSPPSAADIARDRARALYSRSSLSPPRAPTDALPYDADVDRRYPPPPPPPPPGDRRDWGGYSQSHQPSYGERRREWNQSDDDLYWKSQPRRPWDRNATATAATVDKERFERAPPPPPPPPGRNNGWETREERERRTNYPPSTRPSFDGPHSRPLSSRLTDDYPGPGSAAGLESRAYPPPQRELERSRYSPGPVRDNTPPPFSRVRRRSPTPVGRRLSRLPSFTDDMRPPPMKRAREEYPPGYYSPPPPRDSTAAASSTAATTTRRSPALLSDYPPRTATPPPPSSGSSYYDSRGGGPPPPMSGSSSGMSRDREYMGSREGGMDYRPGPPSSYGRRSPPPSSSAPSSRMPPQSYGRNVYGRGGNPRDDRRYDVQHPQPPPPPRTA